MKLVGRVLMQLACKDYSIKTLVRKSQSGELQLFRVRFFLIDGNVVNKTRRFRVRKYASVSSKGMKGRGREKYSCSKARTIIPGTIQLIPISTSGFLLLAGRILASRHLSKHPTRSLVVVTLLPAA